MDQGQFGELSFDGSVHELLELVVFAVEGFEFEFEFDVFLCEFFQLLPESEFGVLELVDLGVGLEEVVFEGLDLLGFELGYLLSFEVVVLEEGVVMFEE